MDSRVSLYGHDANQDYEKLYPVLDRAWFGEMWRGYSEPDLCFSKSQVRDPAYALLDSGATHVLLPGHMSPKGARSFEVTVNLAVGKEKAKCWRNEVYAEDRAHPLLPLGRLANFVEYKVCMGRWYCGYAMQR